MNKKIIVTIFLISFIILSLGWILINSFEKKTQTKEKEVTLPQKNSIILYYGLTCPHCQKVEEWLEKNRIEEKIKIEKKEVYQNRENALELEKIAQSCGFNSSSIGVPFLYMEGKCFLGEEEVILAIKEKIKNKK